MKLKYIVNLNILLLDLTDSILFYCVAVSLRVMVGSDALLVENQCFRVVDVVPPTSEASLVLVTFQQRAKCTDPSSGIYNKVHPTLLPILPISA